VYLGFGTFSKYNCRGKLTQIFVLRAHLAQTSRFGFWEVEDFHSLATVMGNFVYFSTYVNVGLVNFN
jgi:hypothetical protein